MLEQVMRKCIHEAIDGVECGEGGPFGAAILKDGKIIALGHNTVIKTNDPTAHAEINVIREASNKLERFNLSDCILVTSAQPCPMCLSAIMWSNIQEVYYGCNIHDANEIGFADEFIYDYLRDDKSSALTQKELLREEALEAFRLWKKKEDKTPY